MPNDISKVLVLDANQRSALAIIRSLGQHGLKVIAADQFTNSIGAASRFASASVTYPDPATSPNAFVSEVIATVERLEIDTVIPATDLTTMLLVSQMSFPKHARLAAPMAAAYEILTDKGRLLELAGKLGIAAPVTREADTASHIADLAHDIGFPVVLKPARSRYWKAGKIVSTAVDVVEDQGQLSAALERNQWMNDIPCLVQEYIRGHGAGVFALFASSKPVAWFAHRRLREKPPNGGVSVLSESVPIDPVMQSAAEQLLVAAKWSGVAMIEFRVAIDGTPYLMEVNGRFWGSLQLAIDCGVDFPWLLYQATHGRTLDEHQSYSTRQRLRWFLGDLDRLFIVLRDNRLGSARKSQAALAFLRTLADTSCKQEVLRIYDPFPAIREAEQWLTALRRGITR